MPPTYIRIPDKHSPRTSSLEEIAATKEKHLWDPDVFSFSVQSSPTGADAALRIRRHCRVDNPLDFLNPDFLHVWQLDDLVKAAKLLRPKTMVATTTTKCSFVNEHEMRRVYSMIYDVFRCTFVRFDREKEQYVNCVGLFR